MRVNSGSVTAIPGRLEILIAGDMGRIYIYIEFERRVFQKMKRTINDNNKPVRAANIMTVFSTTSEIRHSGIYTVPVRRSCIRRLCAYTHVELTSAITAVFFLLYINSLTISPSTNSLIWCIRCLYCTIRIHAIPQN